MAASQDTLILNKNPQDALISLGNGSLLKGIGVARTLGNKMKTALHNCWVVTGQDTVGADTNVNVKVKTYEPILLTALIVDNDANATTFSSLKVNGETVVSTSEGGSATTAGTAPLADIVTMDTFDWYILIPAGADIEFVGTATNADVVTVHFIGYDLNWARP